MRKLFFGLFLMVAAFSTVGNALAAPGSYTAEVKIDITADSAAAARDKGMKEAYRSAFMAIASRSTNEEGLERLAKLTDDQLINFIKEATVVSEKASDVRYMATLKISINNDLLKTFMQEQNISYVVTSSSNILVIPVFREYPSSSPLLWEQENLWRRAWENNVVTTSPNTYVSIPADGTNTAALDAQKALSLDGMALDQVARHMGTSNIFILDAVYNGIEGLKVTIIPYNGGTPQTVSISGDRSPKLFVQAQPEIVKQIDSTIRRQKISMSNHPSDIMVLFDYNRLSDWIKTEKKIKEVNLVNNVSTIAMGKGKVQFSLSYIGSLEDLTAALRGKSLTLHNYENFYTLENVGN